MINEWQGFAQDLEKAHGAEFVRDLCQTFTDHQRAEEEMAFARQRRIAEANAAIERSWLEGFGENYMSVDAESFFYWARRLGKECWNDKQFLAEFRRDNPETIVKNRPRKETIIRP
jgi:hypothetical protein